MPSGVFDRLACLAGRMQRPERLTNWLRARRERRVRPDVLRSFPICIDLEPTTRCNLRCRTCQQTEPDWVGEDLPVERFGRVLDQLPHLEHVKLQGMGEPLLHERLFDLVRLAGRRRIRVSTTTNGVLLAGETCRREILESGLSELLISVDGARPETHARWRGGSDLQRIIESVRRVVDSRGHARSPHLGIWCVGNPENLSELPALVDLAADLGVDELTYQTQLATWGKAEWRARLATMRINPTDADAARHFEEAREQARRRRFPLTIYTGNAFRADRPCFWPWESCFISVGGQVTPCCIASDPRLFALGQIDEPDFAAIWNSGKYQELRRAIRQNQIPSFCRDCYRIA